MQCYNCKTEYDGPAIEQRNRLLESFFPKSVWVAIKDVLIAASNNSEVSVVGQYFAEKLFSDPEFRQDYEKLKEQYYAIKIKCPKCGQDLYYEGLQSIEHSIHHIVFSAEYKFVLKTLNAKCGIDIEPLLRMVGKDREVIQFAINNFETLLGDSAELLRSNDVFIENLRFKGGRGGDFLWGALVVIRDYLTNEFIKNAVYDLIRSGGMFLLGWVFHKVRDRRIRKNAEKKLIEAANPEKTTYSNDLTMMFQYLTEKEKEALAKKLVTRMAKEKLRSIKKALR